MSEERTRVIRELAEGGCVEPEDEADSLLTSARQGVGPIELVPTGRPIRQLI